MCQLHILAAPAGTGDNQALDNHNSGENTVGIDIDARAVTASPSTEDSKPFLVAKTYSDDSSTKSKGSGQNSGETSSKKDEAKAARMAKINERAKKIAEDNKKRHAAAIAKGNVYELYDPNDIDIV